MKRQNIVQIATVAAVVAWAFVIFSFSLHSGQASHAESNRVKSELLAILQRTGLPVNRGIYRIFYPFLKPGEMMNGDLFVRKTAHVLEYFILGIFCTAAFLQRQWNRRWIFLCIGPAAALVDEKIIQQFLVSGRGSTFHDVALDSLAFYLAVCFGILVAGCFAAMQASRRQRSTQQVLK